MKLTAAGLFIIALAIHVKVTLDDPFVMLSEAAIASGSGSESSSESFKYKQTPERVHCTTTKTRYVKNEDSNLVNYGGDVKAGADWAAFDISS